MNLEESRQEFAKIQKRIASINYATDLLFLDGETVAPPKSSSNRVTTIEILTEELYNLQFGKEITDVVEYLLENESELSLVERRSLLVQKRLADRLNCVPKEDFVRYQSLITSARNAWHIAYEEEDYDILCPHLEQVFGKVREFATQYNSEINPYDYCLKEHAPSTDTDLYDRMFDGIRKEIVPLLREIVDKPPVDTSCLIGDYSAAKQEALSKYIMEIIGLDLDRVGFATSEHPFAKRLGSHFDMRITTKYSRKDFTFSLYTVLFGCGYALAEMGQGDDLAFTFADGSASIGIMSGQTSFYEHIIGRSRAFINYIYPKLKVLFPASMRSSAPEDLYLAVNKVSAGPIRIGADEVSSNLHILIRYELEKALMNKDLSFKDLPDAWNEKYREYLGVDVEDPSHGVLQDVLWADGAIGYLPTAVLGNACSAIMIEKMSKEIDIDKCINEGNISAINQWNREHVWKLIGLYDGNEVLKKGLGVNHIDSTSHIEYLKKKYGEIYNL